MRNRRILVLAVLLAGWWGSFAEAIEPEGAVKLHGELCEPGDLSGLALDRGLLVVCTDEGAKLNVLKRRPDGEFDALPPIQLVDDDDAEIDMEAVTSDSQSVYVVGSHSTARKKLEADQSYAKNRQRLAEIKDEASRYNVFRLKLGDDGERVSQDSISLQKILQSDPILAPFTKLPGKENGIDIEGIAAADGRLYFGFRGPVLRDNYVPVVALRYDQPDDYQLLFVDLDGCGIRDLATVSGGLLVLAGPVGDGHGRAELYCWDKRDCVPGRDSPAGKITHLGTVRSSGAAKPEGIAVLEESPGKVLLLLVCDGVADARVERIVVTMPR